MRSLAIVYLGLLAIAPLCALAQRIAPAGALPRALSRARALDWIYWLVTPLGTGLATRAATLALAAAVAVALGWDLAPVSSLLSRFHDASTMPWARHPLALQALEALVVADLISYWSHRLRHHPGFFPLHAVHHAARELDWLAAARMHPVDDVLDNVAVTLPILLLGFDPVIFLGLGPFLLLHTLYLHSAVRLDLGPLRYVIAGPDFHRWHHALDRDAQGTNFGGVLAIWDVLFGTFRLPRERASTFGVEEPVGETLAEQLIVPVLRGLRGRAPGASVTPAPGPARAPAGPVDRASAGPADRAPAGPTRS